MIKSTLNQGYLIAIQDSGNSVTVTVDGQHYLTFRETHVSALSIEQVADFVVSMFDPYDFRNPLYKPACLNYGTSKWESAA